MQYVEWILWYSLLGSFVGFMSGLLGVGGGGILVPLLTMIFMRQGVPAEHVVHLALGTALASMIVSSVSSIRAHLSRGTIVWSAARGMAPGILLGAFTGARAAAHIDSAAIAIFFAFFMALIALQMFSSWQPKGSSSPSSSAGLLLVGTLIGAVSSLAAVGGGFLTVLYLSFKRFDMRRAVGTSAAMGLPIAVAGTLGYMLSGWERASADPCVLGFVHVPAFLLVAASSALTAPLGAGAACNLPEARLKRVFALLALLLSVRMLVQVLGA